MQPANRVAMNTGFLYGKLLVSMLIALYSTRLVLHALGVEDYGIYNLVGGIIAMLSFLNSAMTVSTQRYLSYYLGLGKESKLSSVFRSSVILHLIIGLAVVLILEIIGIYVINNMLHIPAERLTTSRIVFHFMVISTFFTINAVPYDAAIYSHENMLFDAVSGILESFLKLGIAFWLTYARMDRLILYGLLIAGLTIFIRVVKGFYCSRKYKECSIDLPLKLNVNLIKEMFSFAGWNLFGSFCAIARNQGLAVILNLFFGVIVNAAYAIAYQVYAQLAYFSINMLKALNPQIMKSEGYGDRNRMLRLSMLACKISFFLLSFFAIPLIIEMPYILNLWLKTVPDNTVIFCQLILVLGLFQQLTVGLMSAIQSVGRIKAYQAVVGSLLILNLPLAYGLLKLGYPSYSVFIGSIFLEIIAGSLRIWFAHKLAGLPVRKFIGNTLFKSVLSIVLAAIVAMLIFILLESSFTRVIVITTSSSISLMIFGRFLALESDEYEKIKELIVMAFVKVKETIFITNKI